MSLPLFEHILDKVKEAAPPQLNIYSRKYINRLDNTGIYKQALSYLAS